MKILQLGKFYPIRGGVEKVMYDLASGLSERGITCDILFASANGETEPIVLNEYCRIMRCRSWWKIKATMISPAMIQRLRKICCDYDIIHVHHPDPMACLALFLSGYKGKVVLHWHSDILKQKYLLKVYKPLQRWLIRRADVIMGTTPVYLQESPYLDKVQNKTFCLPIGIDELKANEQEAAKIKARYENRKIIYSMGRLVGYKGYRYLVEAARYLSDDYVVLIGGDGPLHDEIQAQIDHYGLSEKVEILGYIPKEKLSAYYAACTLFCLSSIERTEAFGIVQIEAMSCAKPIVATRIDGSGVSWVNLNGFSGINVEPRNGKDIALAIGAICQFSETYAGFCLRSRQRYEELFTKDKMITKCLEKYENLYRTNSN